MSIHAERRRRRAEYFGLVEEDTGGLSMANTKAELRRLSMANTKAELLEAASAAGLEVDESNTKAELLEALEGSEE